MGKIEVIKNAGGIEGVCVITPMIYQDARGYFSETYNNDDLSICGIDVTFIQDNESYSKKGVLRGFHVNIAHPQAKLIRVLNGEIFDVIIDLRKDSRTYKKSLITILSGENRKQLYVPEGFGHAFYAMSDSKVAFKVTTHFLPGDEIGFAWNSKFFNIEWPNSDPILNEKDKNSPDYSELVL